MQWHIDKPESQIYVSFFQSELQLIAGNAIHWGRTETGGELHGWLSQGGRITAALATPPGPDATHRSVHFVQDIPFFDRTHHYLLKNFAIQPVGDWHSHHTLNLPNPSGGDIDHVRAITTKNNIPRWVQIILTHKSGGAIPPKECIARRQAWEASAREGMEEGRWTRQDKGSGKTVPAVKVTARAFFYSNAPQGKFVPCPIRVVSGMSPFRRALQDDHQELGLKIDFDTPMVPFEWIDLDGTDGLADEEARKDPLPAKLMDQCDELPSEVRRMAEVVSKDGLILLILPVKSLGKLLIAYADKAPYPVRDVYFQGNREGGEFERLTDEVILNGVFTKISRIYERSLLTINRSAPAGERESPRVNDRPESANTEEGIDPQTSENAV